MIKKSLQRCLYSLTHNQQVYHKANNKMQENYFTGQVKTNQSNNPKTSLNSILKQQPQQTVQKYLDSLNINSQSKEESPQGQQTQVVDVKQVMVEPQQQNQDEKFVQSNPAIAAEQKQQGNDHYASGQYVQALSYYRKALQYTASVSQQDKKFRSIIYSNIGLTFMKMRHEQSAIPYFQNSLKLNDKYTKARSNLAQCYENTDKLQEAIAEYKKVLEINPNDAYVRQKIPPLEIKLKEKQQKMQEEVMSGLKNIGNSILGYFGMSLDNFKLQKGPGGGYNIQFKQ